MADSQGVDDKEEQFLTFLASLEKAIGALSERIKIADQVLRRTRVLGAVGLVLFLLVLGVFAFQVNDSKNTADDICHGQNLVRTGTRALWGNVLNQSPLATLPPDATPEQRQDLERQQQVRDQFVIDLRTYFDPIKC